MPIIIILLTIAMAYLLVGVAIANLVVAPWSEKLSPARLRMLLGNVDDLALDTPADLEAARRGYALSTIPWWPRYAYMVLVHGDRIVRG